MVRNPASLLMKNFCDRLLLYTNLMGGFGRCGQTGIHHE